MHDLTPVSKRLTLSPGQQAAHDKAVNWFDFGGKQQFFKLFGYAGTGKTTIAQEIVETLGVRARYAAPTGKAAQVLRRKTGKNATTIHGLMYILVGDDEKGQPVFEHDGGKGAEGADLIVVDECSMIGQEMMDDLLACGKPVLSIGDPAQLPPVKSLPFFQDNPDAMLTEIHRQAADNPILVAATDIREGRKANWNDPLGYIRAIKQTDLTPQVFEEHDQILCGKNENRIKINRHIRKLRGFEGDTPQVGEKVVCLKNNHMIGIHNGETFTVVGVSGNTIEILIGEGDEQRVERCDFDPSSFNNPRPPYVQHLDQFDFGYAITVNKAQGSEWDRVLLVDDKMMAHKPDFRRKWLYTAVTRAAVALTVVEV